MPKRTSAGSKTAHGGQAIFVMPQPAQAPASPQVDGAAGKGGRPIKWDWVGAMIELHRLDAEEGTANKLKAELETHLARWFAARNNGNSPAVSQLRDYVSRFLDEGPKT